MNNIFHIDLTLMRSPQEFSLVLDSELGDMLVASSGKSVVDLDGGLSCCDFKEMASPVDRFPTSTFCITFFDSCQRYERTEDTRESEIRETKREIGTWGLTNNSNRFLRLEPRT